MMDKGDLRPTVEFYDFESRLPQGRSDVTNYVSTVRIMHSIEPPWETLTLTLHVPSRFWRAVFPGLPSGDPNSRYIQTGFWVVVRHQGAAIAWGRCSRITLGKEAGFDNPSQEKTKTVRLDCESWLSWMLRSRVALAPNAPVSTNLDKGHVWDLQSWGTYLAHLLKMFKKEPGKFLEDLFAKVCVHELPPSLVGGAEDTDLVNIPVIWNQYNAAGTNRSHETREVPGLALNRLGGVLAPSTLRDIFAGTFSADPNLIEFFPSLEMGSGDGEWALDTHLRAAPVLMYRLKPYLLRPIDKSMAEDATQDSSKEHLWTASEKVGWFQEAIDLDSMHKRFEFGADETITFDLEYNENDRVNMVSVQTPFTPSSDLTLGVVDKPIFDEEGINRHGLHRYEAVWPFFPQDPPDEHQGNLVDHLNAVIEFAWVCVAKTEAYARGTAVVLYDPYIRAGHWIKFKFPDRTTQNTRREPNKEQDSAKTAFWVMYAYLNTVHHTVEVDERSGITRFRTNLSFSRASAELEGSGPLQTLVGRGRPYTSPKRVGAPRSKPAQDTRAEQSPETSTLEHRVDLLKKTLWAETSGSAKHPDEELYAIGFVALNREQNNRNDASARRLLWDAAADAQNGRSTPLQLVLQPPGNPPWNSSPEYKDRWNKLEDVGGNPATPASLARCERIARAVLTNADAVQSIKTLVGDRTRFFHPLGLGECRGTCGSRYQHFTQNDFLSLSPAPILSNPGRSGDLHARIAAEAEDKPEWCKCVPANLNDKNPIIIGLAVFHNA